MFPGQEIGDDMVLKQILKGLDGPQVCLAGLIPRKVLQEQQRVGHQIKGAPWPFKPSTCTLLLSFTMSLGHVSSSKPIACAMPRASRFSKCSISRFSHGHVMFSSQNSRNIVLVRFGLWLARLGKFNGQVAVGRLVTPETCLDTLLSVTSSPRMLWYSLRSGTW